MNLLNHDFYNLYIAIVQIKFLQLVYVMGFFFFHQFSLHALLLFIFNSKTMVMKRHDGILYNIFLIRFSSRLFETVKKDEINPFRT